MPELRGVECWIEDSETHERLPEYGEKRIKENTIRAYVPSKDRQTFSLNWKKSGSDCPSICYSVFRGDKRIGPLAQDSNGMRFLGLQTSRSSYLPFGFGRNAITGTTLFLHQA